VTLLIISLVVSVAINVLLFWYIRKMLSKLLYVSDSIGSLLVSAKNFSNHLDGLHAMEMYYGDETLGALIKHSKQVIEDIKEFEDIYELTNEGLVEDEEQE
jgi:sensor histidine kinase YesM